MATLGRLMATLLASAVGIGVMVVLATIVFFITTFVVSTGSGLAGYDPSGDFIVLSAALIVVAVILTGGFTPRMTAQYVQEPTGSSGEDPMYD